MKKVIKDVLNILIKNDYKAYIVGGYTRDYLLNIDSYDIDIATNCRQDKLTELFKKYNPTTKLITVSFKINNYKFDVTPLRIEDKYLDNRHPSIIKYTNSIKQDSKRRDLTINSLYMDINNNIYDFYNGQSDLNNKIVKIIGNPNRRFKEDSLRILRCIRFSIKYSFNIDKKTYNAMFRNKELINNLNPDKIKQELNEILVMKNISKYLIEYKDIFNMFIHYEIKDNLNIDNKDYREVLKNINVNIENLKRLNYSKKDINYINS